MDEDLLFTHHDSPYLSLLLRERQTQQRRTGEIGARNWGGYVFLPENEYATGESGALTLRDGLARVTWCPRFLLGLRRLLLHHHPLPGGHLHAPQPLPAFWSGGLGQPVPLPR